MKTQITKIMLLSFLLIPAFGFARGGHGGGGHHSGGGHHGGHGGRGHHGGHGYHHGGHGYWRGGMWYPGFVGAGVVAGTLAAESASNYSNYDTSDGYYQDGDTTALAQENEQLQAQLREQKQQLDTLAGKVEAGTEE